MSVLSDFLHVAAHRPHKVAVADERGQLTFAELERGVRRLAAFLRAHTARPHVGLLLPTGASFPIAFLACQAAGKVPVPMNFLLEKTQLEHVVRDAGLGTVITDAALRSKARGLGAGLLVWEEMDLDASRPMGDAASWKDGDLAAILYTSGTIGPPKGVMLTHRNFTSNVKACVAVAGVTDRDVLIGFLPLFHSFGLTATFLLPLLNGAKAVFLEKFNPGRTAESIEEHGVTILFAIPSMYRFFVRAVEKRDNRFGSLRLCISGGEPLEEALGEAFERALGLPLLNGYGLTETSPVVAINCPSSPRRGSIGPPLPGLEARIADERGRALPPGRDGELWVRGPNVMKGYLNLGPETAAVLDPDGWFHTGDLARTDPDGYLFITGRKKDLIRSSGEFVSPVEVERAMALHPAVFEVAVIGVPDASRGEVPKAFVALKPGESCSAEDLIELCRRHLAKFKIPKAVEFRAELPHGPTGKVLKRLLRMQAEGTP
ncbi:MAG: AMP-binding protein [Planctomycetes bacterium]|nr:AMP-binding protein [Planctomycetota bacterium]